MHIEDITTPQAAENLVEELGYDVAEQIVGPSLLALSFGNTSVCCQDTIRRVHLAHDIFEAVAALEGKDVARRFMTAQNPVLGERTPAAALFELDPNVAFAALCFVSSPKNPGP